MTGNIRPETMERITTPELAKAFIDEQIAEVRAQVAAVHILLPPIKIVRYLIMTKKSVFIPQ